MSTLTYSGVLTVKTCWCGMRHAIPEELAQAANRDNSISVHCPIGHEWVSNAHEKRESEKLREQLQAEQKRLRATRDLLAHEERSHASTRGHLTRQKKRAIAGVCPCCNRTFQQLARHMKSKHPGFTPEAAAPSIGTAS